MFDYFGFNYKTKCPANEGCFDGVKLVPSLFVIDLCSAANKYNT